MIIGTIQYWMDPSTKRWKQSIQQKIDNGVSWVPGPGRVRILNGTDFAYLKDDLIKALKGIIFSILSCL